jgi:methionyl-tRNA synthetase
MMAGRLDTLAEVSDSLYGVKLRAGIARAMTGAQEANAYLNDLAPWTTSKTDMERTGTTLWVALQVIAAIATALSPYLPGTSADVLAALGSPVEGRAPQWAAPEVVAGSMLGELGPLFAKVELDTEE